MLYATRRNKDFLEWQCQDCTWRRSCAAFQRCGSKVLNAPGQDALSGSEGFEVSCRRPVSLPQSANILAEDIARIRGLSTSGSKLAERSPSLLVPKSLLANLQ